MDKVYFRFLSVLLLLLLSTIAIHGCSNADPAEAPVAVAEEEPEAIARTEFTARVENFFEYEPLQSGKPSQFRIHLTDLSDGSPVEQAEVTLAVRPQGSAESAMQVVALVGKITGIYVAEVAIPRPGNYDIEFHIKNTKLDERFPLSDFKVE